MPALIEQNLPPFLADWSPDHRPLSDAHRDEIGRYLMAIVARQAERDQLDPDDVRDEARRLWYRLRLLYDGLRGPFQRSEAEDVHRAMSQL